MGHYASTKNFSFDKATKTFSTEASDLGKDFDLVQIYPDACDEGFVMVSHVTGNLEKFAMSKTVKNAEGEIMAWEFVGLNRKLGLKATIFND